MSPVDVISCIYSVYVLSFWTSAKELSFLTCLRPKFRRSLGYILRLGLDFEGHQRHTWIARPREDAAREGLAHPCGAAA